MAHVTTVPAPSVEDVRDEATRRAIAGALPGWVAGRYHARWWDGAAWAPSLRLRLDGRRRRAVETGGRVLALPGRPRRARRRLALRRSAAQRCGELLHHVPAGLRATVIEQRADAVSCRYDDCGALLVVPAPGDPTPMPEGCPHCGREQT